MAVITIILNPSLCIFIQGFEGQMYIKAGILNKVAACQPNNNQPGFSHNLFAELFLKLTHRIVT